MRNGRGGVALSRGVGARMFSDKKDENMEKLLGDGKKKKNEDELEDEDEWVDMFNPETGEWNGPRLGEPTKFGDWQQKGRTTDFS